MKSSTEVLRRLLDERGVFWIDVPLVNMKRTCWKSSEKQDGYCYFDEDAFGVMELTVTSLTPEQAIAATLGSDRLAFLEEKVRLQGDYIVKLTKENKALFAQSCEAATRHAGQIDAMQRKLDAANEAKEVEGHIGQLKYENDKLRELVAELYQCSRQYGCDRCGYKDGCAMFDRMARLGVEVRA